MTNVLLYSGGLDSYVAHYLLTQGPNAEPWELVYIDLGGRYSAKEKATLVLPHDTLYLPLGGLEQEDAFLPQRNPMLLAFAQAAYDADRVALCAVRGEYSRDKHPEFFRRMSSLLSYTAGKPVRAFSPLARMTKTQAVAAYVATGGDVEELLRTVSCYDPTSRSCGKCMSCYRRWVALANNGIRAAWDFPPWIWMQEQKLRPARLLGLPLSQWPDFGRAQWDALRAHRTRPKLDGGRP